MFLNLYQFMKIQYMHRVHCSICIFVSILSFIRLLIIFSAPWVNAVLIILTLFKVLRIAKKFHLKRESRNCALSQAIACVPPKCEAAESAIMQLRKKIFFESTPPLAFKTKRKNKRNLWAQLPYHCTKVIITVSKFRYLTVFFD